MPSWTLKNDRSGLCFFSADVIYPPLVKLPLSLFYNQLHLFPPELATLFGIPRYLITFLLWILFYLHFVQVKLVTCIIQQFNCFCGCREVPHMICLAMTSSSAIGLYQGSSASAIWSPPSVPLWRVPSLWLFFLFLLAYFFYMKVHSLIHASGIVVFSTFCIRRIQIFWLPPIFPRTIKLDRVVYFFRGAPTGAFRGGGKGVRSQGIIHCLPAPNELPVISVCYELCPMTLPTPGFLSFSLITFSIETINLLSLP